MEIPEANPLQISWARTLTHRGALGTSGSLRTSHSSRTLGRKEGSEVWRTWGRQ